MLSGLSLRLDTACRSEPHPKVLHPSSVRHNLTLALAPTEALLGAGVGTGTTGLWLLRAAAQLCVPRALCELWLLSPTAPWAAGQVQQLHPAEPRWNLSSGQAVLSMRPVTAPRGIPSCCWSSLGGPGPPWHWHGMDIAASSHLAWLLLGHVPKGRTKASSNLSEPQSQGLLLETRASPPFS